MRNNLLEIAILVLLFLTGIRSFSFGQKDSLIMNGVKMEIFTSGLENNQRNKPVVVFENGMATRYIWWKSVIDAVSGKNCVFAYNRPRIGASEDDSLPPTMKHIVDNLLKMKRWLALLNPLRYGKFFYSSNSGHFIQTDDPELIISSIHLALDDYRKIQVGKSSRD